MIEKVEWWELILALFCLITLTQLFYYLYFFRRLAFHGTKQTLDQRDQPVSVIICARDEAGNLAKNLPGVLVQDYPYSHEVLVVNDNSLDETRYLLEALQKDFRQLQIVELKQEAKLIPGKKFPLSIGIKTARHEIVLLTDADCVPGTEFWIQKMQGGFVNGTEIVLGYGAYHKQKGLLNKIIRFETFHTALQYLSYALAGSPYMGVGRNLAYKKDVFFRNKGFSAHNHIAGGDDDLFINMAAREDNTSIIIDKEAFTLSVPKKSWAEWIKQKQRHFSTAKYYRPRHRFLLALYAFSQFAFYPLFVASLIVFDWRIVLGIFAVRWITLAITWYKVMHKLDEKDLWPWFWLFDFGMFFYYLFFAAALWKKPKVNWK
ncbi:MAG: glycosyl transferase family 2 [Bacteroidetes bacterium]|nr:MAG: glycosyl transferase family 2 [Bacteroidota bacterium]